MKRFWKYVTGIVPAYGLFPLVFSFVFNCLVYSGSRAIAGGWYHHNIESNLDLRLPFVPQFLIIYFGCYVFWAVNYILVARQEREQVYRFFTADIISRCVSDHISGISHYQYKTGDRRKRDLGSAGRLAVFH